ncbi:MAG: hypothetical protein AAGI07_18580 [Bacteroidota bacterium]
MKKNILTLIISLSSYCILAQSQGISYQAMIVDENAFEIPGVDIEGSGLREAALTVRFTILNEAGAVDFQEEHATTTDAFGMINLVISTGIAITGSFEAIDWDGTPKSLRVEISIGENTNDFNELSEQELYFVPYAFHRNITATGTLIVDGNTTLNSNLEVSNSSNTSLTGNLAVDGATTLNDAISVNAVSNLNGQVTIDADVNGSQTSYAAYPLRVQGSDQGVAIRLDGGRNTSKNFATFFDGFGTIHGRIEGQTLAELQSSFRFIWDFTMAGLDEAFILAEGVACGTQLDAAEVIVMAAEGATAYAQWLELTINAESNVGVAFETGGADYAEWLEKEDKAEKFRAGEIVGVRGGKISKSTKEAGHVMVISTNPIVVGNLPDEGKEDNYEKVAFLGQVPVRVVGKVAIGDYILPSENHDGLGIAISPEKMQIADYDKVLGVAWEASREDILSYVNVAIGINTNDLASVVAKQEQEIQLMKQQINEILMLLNGDSTKNLTPIITQKKQVVYPQVGNQQKSLAKNLITRKKIASSNISDEAFDEWLLDYGYIFNDRMGTIKAHFENLNIDLDKFPEVKSILENPTATLKEMKSGKYMNTLWQSFENKYFQSIKE